MPNRTLLVATILVGISKMPAQSSPKFEVASVKPCLTFVKGSDRVDLSPGRFKASCLTLKALIGTAYVVYGNPATAPVFVPEAVPDKPEWITTERYDVDAKAAGAPNHRVMEGPMLQTVLEERFKLKLHRESREIPVYELTVAKGGAKLRRVEASSCAPLDRTQPAEAANPDHKPWCVLTFHGSPSGLVVEAHGLSVDRIASGLSGFTDRPVINRTGMEGLYDLQFTYVKETTGGPGGVYSTGGQQSKGAEFGASDSSKGAELAVGPSIFSALQGLGLKLEPAKDPAEYLVIDGVEPPSAN